MRRQRVNAGEHGARRMGGYVLRLALLFLTPGAFGAAAQPYTREVDAIPVRDAEGMVYTHPWLGGLNVPRPQFIDIDNDGDPDLFVQERTGTLIYFENTGTSSSAQYVWRTDTFADLEVGEWARFADLDNDGDYDVLAEQPFSFIRMYQNIGTPTAARFELAVDSLNATVIDNTGATRRRPIFSDRQNVPALTDIDCDGLLDLFIPSLNGNLTYYTHQGIDSEGLPAFQFVTDRFQDLAIVGGFGKRPVDLQVTPHQHGAAAIVFLDLDADGDNDLFWGDFFSPSIYFIENNGTCEAPAFEVATDLFPFEHPLETSGYNVPAFADIDADGTIDFFSGVLGGAFGGGAYPTANFYFYRHDGDLSFTLQSRQFISSLDVGQESMPVFADFDADGDRDLVVGNRIDPAHAQSANLFFYRNEGTRRQPSFRLVGDWLEPLNPDRIFNIAPAVADLDGDADLDILLGRFDGTLMLLENDGTPEQPLFRLVDARQTPLFGGETVDVGQNSTPTFVDIDSDEDLDLVVGEAAGTLNFFRNTGTTAQPRFTWESEGFGGIDAGTRALPLFHDVNGDGLPDLLVGTGQDGVLVYRHTGTAQNPAFALDGVFELPGTVPRSAAPTVADVDADGDADFFIGSLGGGLFFYRNEAIATAAEEPVPLPIDPMVSPYPNPFVEGTTLYIRLHQAGQVRIVIYDVQGRVVVVLADRWMQAGEYRIPFEAQALPTGIYFYTLVLADGASEHGALLRVK